MVVDGKKAPAGVACLHCRRVAKDGDVILVHTIHNVGYFLFHKPCLIEVLDEAPMDSFENLKAGMESGKPMFD